MPALNTQTNDFARGADTALHSIRMLVRTAITLVVAALLLAACIALAVAWHRTTETDRSVAWRTAYAYGMSEVLLQRQITVSWQGGEQTHRVPVSSWLGDLWVQERTSKVVQSLRDGWKIGSSIGAVALFIAIVFFLARGRNLRSEKLIRGAEIVTAKALAWRLFLQRKSSDIAFGGVPLVKGSETQHIFVPGTTGSGKTQLLCSTLDRVRQRGEAAVVYDSTGEFVRAFYRKGDTILSPLDARSPPWTPWAEMRHPADSIRMASAIIPAARGNADPFWHTAAQRLLAGALQSLASKHDRNLAQLLTLLSDPSMDALASAIKDTPIAAILAGTKDSENRLAQSVRGTLLPYIEALQFLPASSQRNTEFSLREWAGQIDTTKGPKPWIFVLSRADFHESLKPLISCWLDSLATGLMSLAPNGDRRLWFVIDELPSLQRLPSILRLLAEGRKFGAACVLALQGIPQLRAVYGADEAEAIAGLCNTHVIFRTNSPDTAQWASRLLGEREIAEAKEAMTYSASNVRDGIHLSEQRYTRHIVLATEVMQLEPLYFYVKLAGNYPIAKTRIAVRNRADVAPPYVDANISNTAWPSFTATETSRGHADRSLNPVSFDKPTKPPED